MERYVVVTGAFWFVILPALRPWDLSVGLSALRPEQCSLLRAPSVHVNTAING